MTLALETPLLKLDELWYEWAAKNNKILKLKSQMALNCIYKNLNWVICFKKWKNLIFITNVISDPLTRNYNSKMKWDIEFW